MFYHSHRAASFFTGIALGSAVSMVSSAPASAQSTQFSDVSFSYWARPFIEKLAEKNIIKGFPDGSFKPDEPVTRAQFAAIVRQAFNEDSIRRYTGFKDVPDTFWATPAISQAYTTGFMSGYPGNEFKPTQQIPKVQALVALTSGLQLKASSAVDQSLGRFNDASDLPDYAKPGIATATETGLVVNYPNAKYLNPNQPATRADIAAFVYQALVNQKQLPALAASEKASSYVVGAAAGAPATTGTTSSSTPVAKGTEKMMASGTQIKLRYPGSDQAKLVVTPGETLPASFEVASDVVNAQNVVLIPKGSMISGQIVPFTVNSTPGAQFVAKSLKVGDSSYTLNALSNPVVAASGSSVTPTSVQGGLTTAAARAALGTIFGGGNTSSILTNVLLNQGAQVLQSSGSTASGTSNSVIIVDPATLVLTTQADVNLSASK
ncbi:MAG: S-layer homology domain-containing protein [Thermosynechococcaceae cyanobacterium]